MSTTMERLGIYDVIWMGCVKCQWPRVSSFPTLGCDWGLVRGEGLVQWSIVPNHTIPSYLSLRWATSQTTTVHWTQSTAVSMSGKGYHRSHQVCDGSTQMLTATKQLYSRLASGPKEAYYENLINPHTNMRGLRRPRKTSTIKYHLSNRVIKI